MEPAHSSHATASDSEGHKGGKYDTRVLEKQVIHGLNDLERNKKFLSEREKNLIHRRQAVEELLLWRKRLELEEERVRALESKALVSKSPTFKPQTSYLGDQDFVGLKADRSTSPLQIDVGLKMREDAATSMADFFSTHSESILEDVPVQSQKSSLSVAAEVESDSKKLEQFSTENLPSPSFESVVNTQMSVEQQSKEESYSSVKENLEEEKVSKSVATSIKPVVTKDDSKPSSLSINIKSPLTPYFVGRQKRRHSSGSDDSIILSQNETASEQSDIESKICALQEQLRRRKMEADLLKKEQKRCLRERLKAKEQSLIKQIQAYDSYIQRAHKELEQEYESPTTSLVKPQIKQRRNWKKKLDESKDIHVEITDKHSLVDSISEAVENLSATASAVEKTEKSPSVEEVGKAASLSENEESQIIPDDISGGHLDGGPAQDKTMGSVSEVMEEIPDLAEDFSENSALSLSRGSSLETTIESPTKHNKQTDSLIALEAEDQGELNKESASVENDVSKPLTASALVDRNDLSKLVEENKSDKYDEDTFEPISETGLEMKEATIENHSEDAHSSFCPIGEEIIEEISHNSAHELPTQLATEEAVHDILTPEKTIVSEDGDSLKDVAVENLEIFQFEQTSGEPISLPSYIFTDPPPSQVELHETFVVSKKIEYEKEADEITMEIFQNLFEESVVEAEILRNKNSACTLELSDCNENVSELSPLYRLGDFEEIQEHRYQLPINKEDLKVVSVCLGESKAQGVAEIETGDRKETMEVAAKESLICDLLMKSLLQDAIFEAIEIKERRKSLFLAREGFGLLGSPRGECKDKMTVDKRNSDVMKRVQQIMLESNLSQVSPREKSRPQDLMITTYDVLSPESSTCNSPVLGHSEMESVFAQVEKISSKQSQKQQGGKPIQFLQVEHGGNLGGSAGSGGSPGTDNEAFSQDWFEEDFGLNSSLREVEEIQLQQLQIEREIEQLQLAQAKEQQQRSYPYNFYIREIPNKPPPPYTPPEETPRLSAAIGGPISPLGTPRDPSPRAVIPTEQEEVASLLQCAVGEFYDCWNRGESLDSVDMPPSFQCSVPEEEEEQLSERSVEEMLQKKSRWSYSQFLFDLSRQLVDEALDNVEGEKWVSVPTKFGSRKLKPTLPLPNKKCFVDEVVKQGLVTLGFIPRETRDNIMFSWTLKKRDRIDEILMREVQEEDRYWTNFDEEEKYLKEQLAESLFELLLVDTSKAVALAFGGRAERMSGANS
ncbi:centrosome-associated protein 350-like [Hetaerina americana]|uniref:centrosome-associated protein 350-like n=1 Tax=Hetaerina americana TaxID=62018 RepID=UPI003A7F252F